MDTGFDVLTSLKWLKGLLLKEVNGRLDSLDKKVVELEKNFEELKKLHQQTGERLSRLEGKYESAIDTLYEKFENNVLKSRLISQGKEIESLRGRVKKIRVRLKTE